MANLMAIISTPVFEKAARGVELGAILGLDRYLSTHRALAPLAEGGALFLCTVRPPEEALWLVAILESPELHADGWHAAPSTTPLTDISKLRGELLFVSGKGITAGKGALAMSLQTPRTLTDADAGLLRRAAGRASAPAKHAAPAAPPPATAKRAASRAAGAAPAAPPPATAKGASRATGAAPAARSPTASAKRAAPAAPPPARSPTETSGVPAGLAELVAACESGDGSAALLAALAAWRAARAPALAELVDAISRRVSGPPASGEGEFAKLAKGGDPLLLGRLLPAVTGLSRSSGRSSTPPSRRR